MRRISPGSLWKISRKCSNGSCWNAKCQAELMSACELKSLAKIKLFSKQSQAANESRVLSNSFNFSTALRKRTRKRFLTLVSAPPRPPLLIAWRARPTRLVRTGGVARPRCWLLPSTACVLQFGCGERGRAGGESNAWRDSSEGTGEPVPPVSSIWRAARFAAMTAGDIPIGRGSNLSAWLNDRLGDDDRGALLSGEITKIGSQSDQPGRRVRLGL